jgi:general secretion pathway protein G
MAKRFRKAAQRGMTLIEIMVVVTILGLIAAAVAVNVVGRMSEARIKQAQVDIQNITNNGIDAYKVSKGRFPSTEEGLQALIKDGFLKANSPDGKLLDPWKREYIYLYPGQAHPDAYDVKSYGADGAPGGDGDNADIVNY